MRVQVDKLFLQGLELKTSKTGKHYATGWAGLGRDQRTGNSKGIISVFIWKAEDLKPDTKIIYNILGELEVYTFSNLKRIRIVVYRHSLTPLPIKPKQPKEQPKNDVVDVNDEFGKWIDEEMNKKGGEF